MPILGALLSFLLPVAWTDFQAVCCWKICEKSKLYEHFWRQFIIYDGRNTKFDK